MAKMRAVECVDEASLISFARDVIEPQSMIRSDGYSTYATLAQYGFQHAPVVVGTIFAAAARARLKSWLEPS